MLIEHRRSQSLVQEAEAKFRAAYYDDALDLLEGCEDWDAPINEDAVLLKGEILNRRNPLASLQELANCQDIFLSVRGMIKYCLVIGRSYALTRNFDAAQAMFRKARKLLKGADADLLPQVALQESRLHWMMGQYDPESIELIHAMQATTPEGKMMALVNRGWIYAGLERYDRQIADFLTVLRIAGENAGEYDVYVVARMLHPLLRVAMETGDDAAVSLGKAAFDGLAWTTDINDEKFFSTRVLGWHAFLNGEAIRAQRYFKQAQSLAPSAPWEIMAHLDRAHVATNNKNELWAMEEIAEAERIAKDVQWASTRGEERMVLTTLGVLVSKFNMAQAQTYIALYNQVGVSSVAPNLAMTRDRRAVADERFASGRVQQVLGNMELATSLFLEAHEIFRSVGYNYRAALAALALHETTGDPEWQRRGAEHGATYSVSASTSVVAPETAACEDEIVSALTPTQKQVLAAICEGLSVGEMADRFNRSVFTINKHIQAVYSAFDVHSRNELRAEAKKRRLFGQVWASSLDTYMKLVKS